MKGIQYKDTFAAKGSDLYNAMVEGDTKKAKAIYDATTERMKALLPRTMTVTDLIEEARNTVITQRHIDDLNARIEAYDKEKK